MPLNQTNPQLAQDIMDIIEEVFIKFGITDITCDINALEENNTYPYVYFDDGTFTKYFYSKNATKLSSVYAYKKASRAISMLSNDELHLTNLELNENNDPSEYEEFFRRMGLLNRMIPDDYCKTQWWLCNQNGELPIDNDKKEIFVYCLTNTFNNPRHWMEYGNNDTGVCIEYDIEVINNSIIPFGRVFYDDGYEFEFIKEIIHRIRRKCHRGFLPSNFSNFSKFYKRDKYRWEDESRIIFQKDSVMLGDPIADPQSGFSLTSNNQVLEIKNNSKHIKWAIKNIYAGNRISTSERTQLAQIASNQYGLTLK